MCTFISLTVLKNDPYGIELRPCSAAVCGASCFPSHMLSPFYLSVDGSTLFHGYQPMNCYEVIYKRKNALAFSVRTQPILTRSSKCNGLSLNTPLIYFLARAFLIMPTSTERLLARQKKENSDTA